MLQFPMHQLGRADPLPLLSQLVEMMNLSVALLDFKASWMKSFSVVMTTKPRTALRSLSSLPHLLQPLRCDWLHGGLLRSPLQVGSQLPRLGQDCQFRYEWLHELIVNHHPVADHLHCQEAVHLHPIVWVMHPWTAACHQVQLQIKVIHCQQVGPHLEINRSLGSSRQYKCRAQTTT